MQTLGIESCMFILMISWYVNKSGRNGTTFSEKLPGGVLCPLILGRFRCQKVLNQSSHRMVGEGAGARGRWGLARRELRIYCMD